MKKPTLLLLLTLPLFLASCNNEKQIKYEDDGIDTCMSFNLRLPIDKEWKSWDVRKDLVYDCLNTNNTDLIGFQECTKEVYKSLKRTLPDFGSIFKGRGKNGSGEGDPVFYNKKVYRLLKSGTFYLNEHPNKQGVGWDAADPRICTYTVLKNRSTKQKMVFASTHLDHIGQTARIEGLKTIKSEFENRGLSQYPFIVVGDFNVPYVANPDIFCDMIRNDFVEAELSTNNGELCKTTFNGFNDTRANYKIDYIVGSKEKIKFNSYEVLNKEYRIDGTRVYASDHYAIKATFSLT